MGLRGARENGDIAFVECFAVSQEDTMEGPLWREVLDGSLESHDAAEPLILILIIGGMCHGKILPARNHPPLSYTRHKDGMELSRPQSSAPPSDGSISSREHSTFCR